VSAGKRLVMLINIMTIIQPMVLVSYLLIVTRPPILLILLQSDASVSSCLFLDNTAVGAACAGGALSAMNRRSRASGHVI